MQVRQVLVWRVEDRTGASVINFRDVLPADAPLPPRPVLGEKVRFTANGRSFEAEVTLSSLEFAVDSLNNIECSVWMQAKEV